MVTYVFTLAHHCIIIAMHLGIHQTSTCIGNIGQYLTNTSSVFISRDGGLTWDQVCD